LVLTSKSVDRSFQTDARAQPARPDAGTASGASWLTAEVVGTVAETPRVRTLVLDAPGWAGHRAGQHLDLRLTAEDGYQAQRSYSIASAPEDRLELTVERLEDGEVSPYLVDEAREGDVVEVRGPIGGYFVWEASEQAPLLVVAGGSGVVPLMSMLRHRARVGSTAPARLLYSSRSLADVIYREELDALAGREDGLEVFHTLTREQPEGWTGFTRRVDPDLLREVAWPATERPAVYVCGSTRFVDAAADGLVGLGYDPQSIRTERFGATGN
jgi:ferredoxin-NADP reductase